MINEYVVLKKLGSGSYGTVKLCYNTLDQCLYAFKIFDKRCVCVCVCWCVCLCVSVRVCVRVRVNTIHTSCWPGGHRSIHTE